MPSKHAKPNEIRFGWNFSPSLSLKRLECIFASRASLFLHLFLHTPQLGIYADDKKCAEFDFRFFVRVLFRGRTKKEENVTAMVNLATRWQILFCTLTLKGNNMNFCKFSLLVTRQKSNKLTFRRLQNTYYFKQ